MYGAILTSLLHVPLLLLLILPSTQGGLCAKTTVKETARPEHQLLHSPNYPNGYFNNELCRWQIDVDNPSYEVVRVRLQNTYIRNSATCSEDYLDIKDGLTAWSRTLRKWCGEKILEEDITSTTAGVFVTFKSNAQYTDKGFELEYWSVPKSIIEVQTVELKLINYILFIIFGVIVLSVILGMVIVLLARRRIQKKLAILKEEEQQRFAIHVEANGVNSNGKTTVAPKAGEYGVKDPLDEKAKKRDSANNGSTTKVIRLEPALGSGVLKETSTTPV